ncbi:MAG: class I SAM-dependent methyltransferase [Acetobacteraceae bacterium]|nr:class I SAM-dependent methyltransferase [Acetobacteraceae bacterium]
MESAEYDLMDAQEKHMWWYRALHARLLSALAGTRGTLLDAGCGTGGFLAALHAHRRDLHAIGLEFMPAAAARANRKSPASIVCGSVNMLPFANRSFDAAVSADVLCHQAVQPGLALAELHRVLRPSGRLVINLPAYAWLMSAHDRRVHNARRHTAREARAMLSDAGFGTIRARYWNGLLLPLMVASRKLRRHAATSDVAAFPPWLDATLHGVTQLERPFRLPMGSSILVTAIRP